MDAAIQCAHCAKAFFPDPRVKNQRYCPEMDCQRARKRKWQKEKLATDPDYKANQRACQVAWHAHHPGYYQEYRRAHPAYRERNNLLQRCRSAGARMIAKMDALKPAPANHSGAVLLLPLIAKMDASAGRVLFIPVRYKYTTGNCKRGLDSLVQQGALFSIS